MQQAEGKHKLKVVSQLGKGAFGTVCKGTYDGSLVAVKTVSAEDAKAVKDAAYGMFKKEADILRHCCHGRIIGYKALCKLNDRQDAAGGNWALVLEYAKGGTLMHKVSQSMISPGRQVYSNAQALAWALDVASALQYLHGRSPAVLHRDVKLSNMLLAKEEGAWVAKLSDFGLHVVIPQDAASSKPPELRQISVEANNIVAALQAAQQEPQQRQQQQQEREGCPAAQHAFYGEMHDSSGSVPYVGMTPGARQELRAAAGAPASRGRAPPRRAASFAGGAPAASAMAAPAEGGARRRAGPSRSVSFRVEPAQQQGDAAGAAGAGGSSSQPARRWTEPTEQFADDASVCSAATMATWVSGSTQCTGTSCSTDDSSSIAEAEQLFNMTGKTGSYLYMAPEVWKNQPYNEKADVFSFGVVLYELVSRCLLIFTELPTSTTDPIITERYAEKVSQGYRPSRPKRMPPGVWELVTACWQQQPAARPAMASVVAALTQLLAEDERGAGSRRSSFSFATPAAGSAAAAANGATAAVAAGAASDGAAGDDALQQAPAAAQAAGGLMM
ncbi:hypothetical protein OEZ85_001556 [Tetradesmus obliquus]|uniref:Protein kinase domain-containing protein n=1 Tax=Tetradesmus obliquus TaxID=3088 RepID=A0ABY8U311_TETOB|nr:hypothetical protein OEZ85_001556 [Tetradesmus obliquus]